MTDESADDFADLLAADTGGDRARVGQLMELLYPELHRIAASFMRRERPGRTIQATALINEAYLRLLRDPLARRAKAVVAIGESRPLVREALAGAIDVHDAASLEDAVRSAHELAKPDGVVLLAPACASFDQFADYAERGERFRELVQTLA